ncbi:MAG: SapC family protein [Magnetococcus sp. WYHC-3]
MTASQQGKDEPVELGIYKEIAVIDSRKHRNMKLKPLADFSYASSLQNAVITDSEFFECAKSQPILFTSHEQEGPMALALLGLKDRQNLFVDATQGHRWRANEYVPAFVRRYPFVFVRNADTLALALDIQSGALDETTGEDLFTADGQPTEFTKRVMRFMEEFQTASLRTRAFIQAMEEMSLLEDATLNWEIGGRKNTFTGFRRVREERMGELTDADILKLVKSGYYKLIVAHLMSLRNFNKLINLGLMTETA